MKTKQYYQVLLILILAGCSTPAVKENPKYIETLSGYIRTDKEKYQPNESITVQYVIENNSRDLYQETITDGSKNPLEPFVSYRFNASSQKDKLEHLDLQNPGEPLTGNVTIKPKETKVFVKNVFTGVNPGRYRLSFFLNWKENKEILFRPTVIEIVGNEPSKQEDKQQTIAPEIKVVIQNLLDDEKSEEAKKEILSYGAQGLVALVEALGDPNEELRREVTFFLTDLRDEYDVDPIAALGWGAQHENAEIRMRSIYIAGLIGPHEIIQVIRDRLENDPDKNVRLTCFRAIKPMTDVIAVQMMIFALNDEEQDIRELIISNLRERTGQEFGYDPEADEEQRKKAILEWRKWAVKTYRGK